MVAHPIDHLEKKPSDPYNHSKTHDNLRNNVDTCLLEPSFNSPGSNISSPLLFEIEHHATALSMNHGLRKIGYTLPCPGSLSMVVIKIFG